MYKIGEFSRLCGLTIKTLRFYGEKGVLTPSLVDKYTGYRYYKEEQLEVCKRITAFKEAGFSLDEITDLLKASKKSEAEEIIERKKKMLAADIAELEKKIERIDMLEL